MDPFTGFIVAVMASLVANLISKWFDGNNKKK